MKNKQFTNKGIMIVKGILQEDESVHGKAASAEQMRVRLSYDSGIRLTFAHNMVY